METTGQEVRLTAAEVAERVEAVRAIAHDDVEAHVAEYTLYVEVLRAIAEGRCEAPGAVARAALGTQDIPFNRWSD